MVNHCANPMCHKPLHYLREGKVFLFSHENGSSDSKLPQRMEHYWLCGVCAKQWTMASDGKRGVKLVQTRRRNMRASYAVASAAPAS